MSSRLTTTKTVLWLIVGVLATVSAVRFLKGLGATTNLSDAAPWGLWIAFDVMSGVALAAGGFVTAAAVYIFRFEHYRPIVRPAVLTAFLGYAAVATSLLYDIGIPWHIWHPMIYPQPHSVLFEVAMCVMLYLTVLFLEFSPAILEHHWFGGATLQAAHRILKKSVIGLVIAGIVLSTLHQSSLGSLFLIAPFRVHPLWYSPIIPVLFLVSAIGLGLMVVVLESFISAWLFGHRLRMDILSGLGKAASVVLFLYAVLRLGDLWLRGVAFDSSPLAWLFVFEIMLSAIVPAVLLAIPRVRNNPRGLLTASIMTILGVVGYRFNVCVVAFARPAGASYFPSWIEFAVSLGMVAGALLVFIFFVEHLKVYSQDRTQRDQQIPADEAVAIEPRVMQGRLRESWAAPRRYSLAFVLGAAIATAFLPSNTISGAKPLSVPVSGAREVDGFAVNRAGGRGHDFVIAPKSIPPKSQPQTFMIIDGNRNARMVIFPHDEHVKRLGGKKSCNGCHHRSMPYHRNSSCAECHRDMYSTTDTFNHSSHILSLGGNKGCVRCHTTKDQPKTRRSSTPCAKCHVDMAADNRISRATSKGRQGFAPSYMDAMHGLCIRCHEEKARKKPANFANDFALCTGCHRDVDGSCLKRTPPYKGEAGNRK